MAARPTSFKAISLLVIFVMVMANFYIVQAQDGGSEAPVETTETPGAPSPTAAPETPAAAEPAPADSGTPPVVTGTPVHPAEMGTQAPPQPTAGTPPTGFSLSGTVTNKDGQGLAGVEVSDDQGHHVRTDENGFYGMDGLAPGVYQVRASLAGFELIPYFRVVHLPDENVTGVDFYPRQAPPPEYTNRQPLPVNHPPALADIPAPAGGEMESQAVTTPGQPGSAYAPDSAWQVGTTGAPYAVEAPGDMAHFNAPTALAFDEDGRMWEAEERGNRLVAFDSSSLAPQLIIGDKPGLSLMDHYTFNSLMAVAFQPHTTFIWAGDSTRLVKYDISAAYPGQYALQFPAVNPWESRIDNGHFSEVRGIAFDTTGELMFVSDRFNHRIQVYDASGTQPAYLRTLGVTDVSGNDSTHFNQPWHLAYFDGYVYVADSQNHRIQKCPTNGIPCTTVAGVGQAGFELNQLDTPTAVALGNAKMYITDSNNQRVIRCDFDYLTDAFVSNCDVFYGETGNAGSGPNQLRWPADVLAQGDYIYVADRDNHRILEFNDTGSLPATPVTQLGSTGEAYPIDLPLADQTHVNQPWGIAVDSLDHDNLYVAENWGYSLAKFYTSGENSGKLAWLAPAGAGNCGSDLHQFGNFSGSNQGNIAVDGLHRIFVPDAGNHRVMVYKDDGAIFGQIGAGQPGSGPYQFDCPNGVGISQSYIFVADTCNQRVQVFDLSFKYVGTLGQTGVAGADGQHFSNPVALAVDAVNNNIFVVDQGNQRVQRCHAVGSSANFTCTPFAGVSGVSGGRDFRYLNHPVGVAFDPGSGTVLISEEDTSRIQVFKADTGAYLTTISGEWGDEGGRVRSPAGITVGSDGAVYVADRENARIQRFGYGVPAWRQININGFGSPLNLDVTGLTTVKVTYQGVPTEMLYTLTSNAKGGQNSAQVWRRLPDDTWQAVSAPGFGDVVFLGRTGTFGLTDMAYYSNPSMGGSLYVGAYNPNGARIWRCKDLSTNPCEKPSDWTPVPGPMGSSVNNKMVSRMLVFHNLLFVSLLNWSGTGPYTSDGGEVWAYDGNNWTSAEPLLKLDGNMTGAGHAINGIHSMAVSSDGTRLYGGTADDIASPTTPAQLYCYALNPGSGNWEWHRVKENGISDTDNTGISSLLDIDGHLYVGTSNSHDGAMIYRYNDFDLSGETVVVSSGLDSIQNVAISGMIDSGDHIYALATNHHTGVHLFSASLSGGVDGAWSLFTPISGFGNSANHTISGDSSLSFSPDGHLLVGTWNDANGGALWLYAPAGDDYHIGGDIHYSGTDLKNINVILQPTGLTTHPDDSGHYIFDHLLPAAYTVTAQYNFLSFSPPVQPVTIRTGSVDGVDFTAASGGVNLTQPPNGTQLTSLNPVSLQWDAWPGATSYTLQVSNTPGFSSLLKNVTQAATTFKLAGLSANKTYYWKVRKANSPAGLWSVTYSFKTPLLGPPAAPVLQTPNNKSSLPAGILAPGSFTWKASVVPTGSTPVQHYHIQVSRLDTFIPLDIDEYSQGAATAFNPVARLTPNQVYYWRVRAFNTAGDASAWSSTFSFKVKPVAPLSARAYDTNTLQPGLHWIDPYCTGKYLVELYNVSSTRKRVKSGTVTTNGACEGDYKLSASLAVNTKYEWRVTTQGATGSSLPLTNPFSTPSSVPGTPGLVGPANNLIIPAPATYPDWQPTFTWQAVTSGSPQYYEIQIAGQPGFGSSILANDRINVPASSYQAATPAPDNPTYRMATALPYNTTVYWRVRACNEYCSIWSAARKLVTRPGMPVDLTSSGNSVDTTFQWTDPGAYTHFANSYSVAIYSNPPACTTVLKTLASTTTSTHLALAAGTSYCAKVGGVGPTASITGPYSAALVFKTVNAPPAPALILPKDKALITGNLDGLTAYTVNFSWEALASPAPDVDVVYHLQVSTFSDFSNYDINDEYQASPSVTYHFPAGKWYWRVRTCVEGIYSLWSPARSFSTPGQISGGVSAEQINALAGFTVTVSGVSGSTTTDSHGSFSIANVPAGTHTLTVKKDGLLTQTRTLTAANASISYEHFYMLPSTGASSGNLRIVLTWNPDNSRSLDTSLWLPAATPFHVMNPTVGKPDLNAFPNAFIDKDDQMRGIEVIDVKPVAGKYTLAVNQIAPASSSWSGANAKVEVYWDVEVSSGGESLTLLKSCSQPSGSGAWWYAFDLEGTSVTCKNSMRSTAPAPYGDHPISGHVYTENSHNPLSDVSINYGVGEVVTDENGFYSIPGIVAGSYTLTPAYGLPVGSFSPASAPDVAAGHSGVDFYASLVSTPEKLSTVTVQGDYAYLGAEGWLYIVNVHDKSHPTEAGRLWIDKKTITSIVVSGAFAYVLSDWLDSFELTVLDVSDPAHPRWVGSELNSVAPFNLAAYGQYLLVSANRYVHIYHQNSASAPHPLTHLATLDLGKDWAAQWVAVSGHYAYVAGWPYGLDVYDLSDPAHPAGPWHYTTPASFYNLVVDGQYAYLGYDSAEADEHVLVLNVADPAHIYQMSLTKLPGYRLEKAGSYLYIAQQDSAKQLVILDVSDPANPYQAGSFTFPGRTVDVKVQENYAFVIDAGGLTGTMNILDVTNKNAPVKVGAYTPAP